MWPFKLMICILCRHTHTHANKHASFSRSTEAFCLFQWWWRLRLHWSWGRFCFILPWTHTHAHFVVVHRRCAYWWERSKGVRFLRWCNIITQLLRLRQMECESNGLWLALLPVHQRKTRTFDGIIPKVAILSKTATTTATISTPTFSFRAQSKCAFAPQ